jgi:hypothetical protein
MTHPNGPVFYINTEYALPNILTEQEKKAYINIILFAKKDKKKYDMLTLITRECRNKDKKDMLTLLYSHIKKNKIKKLILKDIKELS